MLAWKESEPSAGLIIRLPSESSISISVSGMFLRSCVSFSQNTVVEPGITVIAFIDVVNPSL